MLTALRKSDRAKVNALLSERTEAPFVCPKCQCELILHKGRIKIHHFSHKPHSDCTRGEGETLEHLAAKQSIFDALKDQPCVKDLEIEKDFG